MADQMLPKRLLPAWAEQIRQKYLAGEASVFVLYGNVFDRCLVDGIAYGMTAFLSEVLLKDNKQRIYEISLDRGFTAVQAELSAKPPADLRSVFQNVAGILIRTMGGTAGPLVPVLVR